MRSLRKATIQVGPLTAGSLCSLLLKTNFLLSYYNEGNLSSHVSGKSLRYSSSAEMPAVLCPAANPQVPIALCAGQARGLIDEAERPPARRGLVSSLHRFARNNSSCACHKGEESCVSPSRDGVSVETGGAAELGFKAQVFGGSSWVALPSGSCVVTVYTPSLSGNLLF